jgi:hypothetical protein
MKVRTCVIFACMTVVPAIALFSHWLPASLRDAARVRLWEPVEAWVASLAKRPDTVAEIATASTPEPTPASESVVPAMIPATPLAPTQPASLPSASKEALASLGAVSIDCRPFDGLAGTHVASCRVPVDTAGQLHRVFQAAGGNPAEAMDALLDTVRAWKQRVAGSGGVSAVISR